LRSIMRAWLFRELSPFGSHVAIAVLAVITWMLVIVPVWRHYRARFSLNGLRKISIALFESLARLTSRNKSLTRWLAVAATVLFVFAVGLWTGWHKEAILLGSGAGQRRRLSPRRHRPLLRRARRRCWHRPRPRWSINCQQHL